MANDGNKFLFFDAFRLMFGMIRTQIDLQGLSYIDEKPISLMVSKQIMMRIARDLRSVHLLLRDGYVDQALTITSSIQEQSFLVAYIRSDDTRANKWLLHNEAKWADNWNNWLGSVAKMVALKEEWSVAEREDWERVERDTYALLSARKHGNAFAVRKTGVIMKEDGRPFMTLDPILTIYSHHDMAYAAFAAIRLSAQALKFYISAHSPGQKPGVFSACDQLLHIVGQDVEKIRDYTLSATNTKLDG